MIRADLCFDAIVIWYLIPHAPNTLKNGLLAFVHDATFEMMFVYAGGGIASDSYVVYYILLVAHAFRFPRGRALVVALWAMGSYALIVVLAGNLPPGALGILGFRLLWMPPVALLSILMVERARSAESSLADELQRTRALLQAAHAPAASLTIEGVLEAVVQQARGLTTAELVAVRLYPTGGYPSGISRYAGFRAQPALETFISRRSSTLQLLLDSQRPQVSSEWAADGPDPDVLGEFSSVCALEIPGEDGPQGIVVAATRGADKLAHVQFQALAAFIERAALAIQNARLYERLQAQMEELRSLHDQIVRAERLAAIGQLAAKVAHEINNPLATIHLNSSLLYEAPANADEQQEIAETIMEQVDRAKRVVREILDYSRPKHFEREEANLNVLVERAIQLAWHAAAGNGFRLIRRFSATHPTVSVDSSQLTQVVVNLALNAIQAMPDGGTLQVETGSAGCEAYIKIADTGTGITHDDLPHIFDAFFTTRGRDRGTGLGLAVSHDLVAEHGGRITVESEPQRGSIFTVWLPLAGMGDEQLAESHGHNSPQLKRALAELAP